MFQFAAPEGLVVTNADLPIGLLRLFVFVDPDCDHCQRAVSHMNEQAGAFAKVAVYFVSSAAAGKLDGFARRWAPKLRAMRNVAWCVDPGDRYAVRFRPVRYPALFLYSRENKLLDYEDNAETVFRIVKNIEKNPR